MVISTMGCGVIIGHTAPGPICLQMEPSIEAIGDAIKNLEEVLRHGQMALSTMELTKKV